MEQKSFFQRIKENPFSWLFSGELFFLTLNSLFLLVVLLAIISFIASFFTKDFEDPSGKALVLSPAGPMDLMILLMSSEDKDLRNYM